VVCRWRRSALSNSYEKRCSENGTRNMRMAGKKGPLVEMWVNDATEESRSSCRRGEPPCRRPSR
jgi:hypothetical protein